MPSFLPDLAVGAVVRLLNRLADREAWAQATLRPFAGRSAQLEAAPFSLTLAIDDDGRFATGSGTPDVTIAIDAARLPAALIDPQAMMRNVRLSGDAEFAQALSQVLQRLRPEPEEELARVVGDAAAVRIVGFLRSALAQAREGGARLAGHAANYLAAENAILARGSEVERFAREVHALRDAVERLDKRLAALQGRRPA